MLFPFLCEIQYSFPAQSAQSSEDALSQPCRSSFSCLEGVVPAEGRICSRGVLLLLVVLGRGR